jgi:SulP family sulfate permease
VLVPKIVTTMRAYDRAQFMADLSAGVIVGIVALPLAIAFAIASGVTPDRGLYTAVIAGFLISALGGSRVQIGGPTGAFVVIVYGIVRRFGVDGLRVATIMGGVMLIGFGLARLGGAIKFIPFPVVTGFTSGIALIIFSAQVKDLLGLDMGALPADFLGKWAEYARHLGHVSPAAALVSGVTLAILVLWPRLSRRVPGPFVALVATPAMVHLLHLPVETIGSRFGAIDAGFPRPSLPRVSFATVTALVGPAFTIALLAGIESLLSAVVSDGMIGGKHRSNMELVAQGVANIASQVFGGIPATGAIGRTATNVKNGGRTPVRTPRVLIIRMRNVPAMDSTGLNALRDVVGRFRRAGSRVILSDVHAQPMVALRRSALGDELEEEDLVGNIDDALNVTRAHLGLAPVSRPAFAVPTVAREDRRRHPRPPA